MVFNDYFNKHGYNFDDANEMATLNLLRIKVFWDKVYDVRIFSKMPPTKFYHVIQIILQMWSCNQSLVTLGLLWEKFSQPQFYKDLTTKTLFFEGWSWFKFHNLGMALGIALKFCISVAKGSTLNSKGFWG